MVQNLRAYSIFHVVAIKWIVCVQENIELPSTLLLRGDIWHPMPTHSYRPAIASNSVKKLFT